MLPLSKHNRYNYILPRMLTKNNMNESSGLEDDIHYNMIESTGLTVDIYYNMNESSGLEDDIHYNMNESSGLRDNIYYNIMLYITSFHPRVVGDNEQCALMKDDSYLLCKG